MSKAGGRLRGLAGRWPCCACVREGCLARPNRAPQSHRSLSGSPGTRWQDAAYGMCRDNTGGDFASCKQRRCAMPNIRMHAPFMDARPPRQQWLRARVCLDLAILGHTGNQRPIVSTSRVCHCSITHEEAEQCSVRSKMTRTPSQASTGAD